MSYEESGVDTPSPLIKPKSAIGLPPSPSAAFEGLIGDEYIQPLSAEKKIMGNIESSFSFSNTDYRGNRRLQESFGIKQKKTFGPHNLPSKKRGLY